MSRLVRNSFLFPTYFYIKRMIDTGDDFVNFISFIEQMFRFCHIARLSHCLSQSDQKTSNNTSAVTIVQSKKRLTMGHKISKYDYITHYTGYLKRLFCSDKWKDNFCSIFWVFFQRMKYNFLQNELKNCIV